MYQIVIIKKVDGKIKKRYSVGYTADFEMYHKVKKYFNETYKNLKDFDNYTVTVYLLRPVHESTLEYWVDRLFKD